MSDIQFQDRAVELAKCGRVCAVDGYRPQSGPTHTISPLSGDETMWLTPHPDSITAMRSCNDSECYRERLGGRSTEGRYQIRAILAAQGAGLGDVVRLVAYLTDMRDKATYEQVQREALGDVEPPPHSLIGVSALAWPGMVVEIEATAVVSL